MHVRTGNSLKTDEKKASGNDLPIDCTWEAEGS
jgi:hypothetical protein